MQLVSNPQCSVCFIQSYLEWSSSHKIELINLSFHLSLIFDKGVLIFI